MATIDASYFFGDLLIAQKSDSAVAGNLNWFIDEHEPRLLADLLGYDLYQAYAAGITAGTPLTKWTELRDGVAYTNRSGISTKWPGLRFSSSGTSMAPITDIVRFLDPVQFKIGDGGTLTPAAGTIRYTNPILENIEKERLEIFRNEYGILFPDLHFTKVTADDFFELIAPDQFGADEEFTLKITIEQNAAATISAGAKKSLIANYIYWLWMANEASNTTGTGEKITANQNAVTASPASKMIRAWNQMVDWNKELIEFLLTKYDVYPEFVTHYPRIPISLLKKQNALGI